jgi:hypothetical protein
MRLNCAILPLPAPLRLRWRVLCYPLSVRLPVPRSLATVYCGAHTIGSFAMAKKVHKQTRRHEPEARCYICKRENLTRRAKVREGHLVCGSCRDKNGL